MFSRIQLKNFTSSLKISSLFKRNLFIKTEPTPNPNSLIYRPENRPILGKNSSTQLQDMMTVEITSALQASRKSGLADEIFKIEGIESILLGSDFLTVTKSSQVSWPQVNPQVFAAIMDFFTTGQEVLKNEPVSISGYKRDGEIISDTKADLDGVGKNAEILEMIKEILDTRIRPTIQDDGGDVELRGFDSKTGWVQLKLVGACRTCSSSTITLRNGIESMLMHYIPEVKGVEQVTDEEEIISNQEFEKFEKDLNEKRRKE